MSAPNSVAAMRPSTGISNAGDPGYPPQNRQLLCRSGNGGQPGGGLLHSIGGEHRWWICMGRMAVDHCFQRRGLGELMLMNAVHRTIQDAAAAFALLVDAKNDQAAAFYRRYGFRPVMDRPRTLFLPLAAAQKTLLR